MKIAIPIFNERVSPRFDNAQDFIVLTVEKRIEIERQELPVKKWTLIKKIMTLIEREVDTVICGGIDRSSMQQLSSYGINVYSWVTGNVEDALSCFLKGELDSGCILGAGGKTREQWRFRRKKKNMAFNDCGLGKHNQKEEVINMSGIDGTGAKAQISVAGRGRGGCNTGIGGQGSGGGQGVGSGRGAGGGGGAGQDSGGRRGRSFGGGMGMRRRGCGQMNSEYNCSITEGDRSFLEEQKSHLENRLSAIKMRLETLASPAKPDTAENK
ncbi:MAG: NifB/NifX family molybdenum-iron cluster-binding protein [Desulfamplus sp.]|nr:NifB/NifX family molybdenum-iron cluster-binding protein [Desulfamplus sp.]